MIKPTYGYAHRLVFHCVPTQRKPPRDCLVAQRAGKPVAFERMGLFNVEKLWFCPAQRIENE